MESGSLPRSQDTVTGPDPQLDASTPHLHTLLPQDPF